MREKHIILFSALYLYTQNLGNYAWKTGAHSQKVGAYPKKIGNHSQKTGDFHVGSIQRHVLCTR